MRAVAATTHAPHEATLREHPAVRDSRDTSELVAAHAAAAAASARWVIPAPVASRYASLETTSVAPVGELARAVLWSWPHAGGRHTAPADGLPTAAACRARRAAEALSAQRPWRLRVRPRRSTLRTEPTHPSTHTRSWGGATAGRRRRCPRGVRARGGASAAAVGRRGRSLPACGRPLAAGRASATRLRRPAAFTAAAWAGRGGRVVGRQTPAEQHAADARVRGARSGTAGGRVGRLDAGADAQGLGIVQQRVDLQRPLSQDQCV